ncbi:MAG: FAD binding domain-containing protein, partial [Burkholderiales bacterium]
GPLMTAAAPDECLEEIRWPAWPGRRTGSAFIEVSRRHGDFAIAAAAAQVALDGDGRCERASFGLGGGGTTPRAFPDVAKRLVGTRLEDAAVKSAAHDAAAGVDFYSDLHASADYRRHLAGVLATRALRAAHEQAKSKN